jgi:hypothetical protein
MRLTAALALALALSACKKQEEAAAPPAPPAPGTPEYIVQNALSAAPEAVASGAMVVNWPATDTSQMDTLRAGTNGWTCVPDDPRSPGNDPGCADDELAKYWDAWMARTPPRLSAMAVGYVLQGMQVVSTTDPFKMAPDSGQAFINVGPSVMIAMPGQRSYRGLPTTPSADAPWVLWSGTPYALIIVPAGGR